MQFISVALRFIMLSIGYFVIIIFWAYFHSGLVTSSYCFFVLSVSFDTISGNSGNAGIFSCERFTFVCDFSYSPVLKAFCCGPPN